MNPHPPSSRRLPIMLAAATVAALATAAAAAAHARISPPVSLAKTIQLYSLAVPTEIPNAYTTKIVLTVPKNFSIDSFVPAPGWHRVLRQTASGGGAVVEQVAWTGGHVPAGEDALFQFLGEPAQTGTYAFPVVQTYSNGSIVDWSGPDSSADPAPTIAAKSSLGGGGTSTLTIVALVVGAIGVILGAIALVAGGGGKRQLT